MTIKKRNNITVRGTGGMPIIFAHGFGCDQRIWHSITPAFEDDYKVVLFDHVGSGQSDMEAYSSSKYASLHGYADDVQEIVESLGIKGAVFVGHSVSAVIGLLASIKQPDIFSKIILVGPSARYLNDKPHYLGGFEKEDVIELLEVMEMNFIGWASSLVSIALKGVDSPDIEDGLKQSLSSGDPAVFRQFAEVTFLSDHRDDLKKAEVESLILQCAEDSIVPIEAGEYIHHHLKNSEFRIMDVRGHYPHLSHPKETIFHIKDFLMGQMTGSATRGG